MNKFEQAQEVLKSLDADGWLIISDGEKDPNSPYLMGVIAPIRHYIYIDRDGNHKIISVLMEAPMIKHSLEKKGIPIEVIPFRSIKQLVTLLIDLLKSKRKIALDFGENITDDEGSKYADNLTVGDYNAIRKLNPNMELISAAPIISKLRTVKSSDELKDMRNTCKATMEIYKEIPNWVKIGMTERELGAKIDYEYSKLGHPSFNTIVGTGPHSADPHHNTSSKKIEPGPLLIDSGMQIDQMCSDVTWTYWVKGNPSEKFVKAYKALYSAKVESVKYYTHGTKNNVPALKCRQCLSVLGYDHQKLYIHSLGHSLGFEVHDVGKGISASFPDHYVLEENMVITQEPGLYWMGEWGVRLEDDVVISKDNPEVLTNVPKDPIII